MVSSYNIQQHTEATMTEVTPIARNSLFVVDGESLAIQATAVLRSSEKINNYIGKQCNLA